MASTRTTSKLNLHPAKQDMPESKVPEIPYLQAGKKTPKRKVTKEVDDDYSTDSPDKQSQKPRVTHKKHRKILSKHCNTMVSSERNTAIRTKGQKVTKVIPDPDPDSKGYLYFEFTADSKYEADTLDSTTCMAARSASDHATGSSSSNWIRNDSVSDNEPQNQRHNPEMVLLRSVADKPVDGLTEHLSLIKEIVGVQQLVPEHDTLIHYLDFSDQISIDAIADRNLQAQIKDSAVFKEAVSLLEKQFHGVILESNWIRNNSEGLKNITATTKERRIYAKKIAEGFVGQDSMKNGPGKNSCNNLVLFCKDILKDMGIEGFSCDVYGNKATHSSVVYYQDYLFAKNVDGILYRPKTDEQLTVGLQKTTEWVSEPLVSETNCDLVVEKFLPNSDDLEILIIVEVKSICESTSLKKCLYQTWLQALAGLKTRNITYGILYTPLAIYILQISKEKTEVQDTRAKKPSGQLVTSVLSFKLIAQSEDKKTEYFDVSKLTDFMHFICCVLAESELQAEAI